MLRACLYVRHGETSDRAAVSYLHFTVENLQSKQFLNLFQRSEVRSHMLATS